MFGEPFTSFFLWNTRLEKRKNWEESVKWSSSLSETFFRFSIAPNTSEKCKSDLNKISEKSWCSSRTDDVCCWCCLFQDLINCANSGVKWKCLPEQFNNLIVMCQWQILHKALNKITFNEKGNIVARNKMKRLWTIYSDLYCKHKWFHQLLNRFIYFELWACAITYNNSL